MGAMNDYSPVVPDFMPPEDEAAYERWFVEKVREALDDPRPPVPHEEAMARVQAVIDRAARRKTC
jgi:hypothetical protein